jgi:hypothetical protein
VNRPEINLQSDHASLMPDGRLVVTGTRCRRCLGSRLWVDFTGELQCVDCDPPQKVLAEKIKAKMEAKRKQERSIILLDQEDEDERLRREYSERTGKTS